MTKCNDVVVTSRGSIYRAARAARAARTPTHAATRAATRAAPRSYSTVSDFLPVFLETLKQPRAEASTASERPAMALEQPSTVACERAPASDPDPETIIQPEHSPGFIARVAAHRMQAQVKARARARLDPPAQHDDLLADPACFVPVPNERLPPAPPALHAEGDTSVLGRWVAGSPVGGSPSVRVPRKGAWRAC
jgi:hypothetical protein